MRSRIAPGLTLIAVLLAAQSSIAAPAAQQEPPPELVRYADLVLHNGKVLTLDRDDASFTITEALAVRDGRILTVGPNQAVLRLAGPQTRRIDLQGRTVIPGIIDTHAHLQEYAASHWGRDAEKVESAQVRRQTWAENRAGTLATVERLASEIPEGRWIQVSLPQRAVDVDGSTVDVKVVIVNGLITRHDLDPLSPRHPVIIQGGTRTVFNTRALDEMIALYGALDEEIVPETGIAESVAIRRAVGTDILIGDLQLLRDLHLKELLEWASYGVTTWSSSLSALLDLNSYAEMDRRGELPIRLAYTHAQGITSSNNGPEFYRHLGDIRGVGTPYLWNVGSSVVSADGSYPQIASIAPAAPEIKQRELSRLAPGQYRRRTVEAMIGAGQRIAGLHVAGDLTLDHLLDAIEEQSVARGMTLDDIRAMRHASDHCAFNPRPDQFARLIRLNIYMSCAPKYLLSVAPEVAEDYGPEFTKWVVPVKSMLDAGVRVVYESDVHDLDRKGMLYYLELLVSRQGEDGQVWNPEERIDRVTALMLATRWAAEYVLRERDLGSLEVGKWADLVVLDRDYLTVPVEEISEIRSVMTLVGGKIAYEQGS